MKTINRHSQEFKDLAAKILSGELSRLEASNQYGINPGTLAVWMSRSNLTSKGPDGVKKLHGAALESAITDPDKVKLLEEAVARVLDGELSATEAAEKYPTLAQVTIAKRVRKYRQEHGMTVQKRRTRAEMELARLTTTE